MNIQLSEHFTYKKLIRFTIPSIIMMVFTSIYGVVDGLFVSNFVGKTPFAAINLIMPVLMIFGAIGFMVGTGGSALISLTLGEGRKEKANQIFSFLTYFIWIIGIILTVIAFILMPVLSKMLGAKGEILEYCILYGRVVILALPSFMIVNVFQSFFITAEKPHLGLTVTIITGLMNMVLDALFIAVFKWGVVGAAAATAISQVVGGVFPMVYFMLPNKSQLRLGRTHIDGRALLKTCTNGSSELMTNISMSLVNILYNYQLMRIAGQDGIAAYGVIMYVNFIFAAVFIGYSIGTAPIIGYHYGAANKNELKNLFKKSIRVISVMSITLTVLAEVLAYPLAKIFVGYDQGLLAMTHRGFMIYSFAFLLSGFSMMGSSFFTALNNGAVSAGISFLRTLVFQIAAVLILPIFFQLDGIWASIVVAEFFALLVTIFCFVKMRHRYGYY